MYLIKKSLELLSEKIPFVTVHVYKSSNEQFPIGMYLLVTEDNVFFEITNVRLKKELVRIARDILEENRSIDVEIVFGNESLDAFFEVSPRINEIIILGAGHIAVSLCDLAKVMKFHVTIIDDRSDYANNDRFPKADNVIAGNFLEILERIKFTMNSYVVLITRGHTFDSECLEFLLPKQVAYIGMIGSLRRLKGVFKLMEKKGYATEKVNSIHAPIGLPIGGDSPEEIALGIISEIVSVQNRGKDWSLNLKSEFHEMKKNRAGIKKGKRKFFLET